MPLDPKMGCSHYKRRCKKRCPECLEFFSCRFCHDDVKYYNSKDIKKSHQMDRHAVTEIKCNECDEIQKPQQSCQNCKIEFAGYFCAKCNLFDDDFKQKKNYHCDKCGICRVGGKEQSYHCDKCECCLPLEVKDDHNCIKGTLKQDCAVCMTDMYTSRETINIMNCGHAIHETCFLGYLQTSIACPICKKSLVDPKLLEADFDQQFAEYHMSKELQEQKMFIMCNDCFHKSEVGFHVMGGKCVKCRSYNTTRIDEPNIQGQIQQKNEGAGKN